MEYKRMKLKIAPYIELDQNISCGRDLDQIYPKEEDFIELRYGSVKSGVLSLNAFCYAFENELKYNINEMLSGLTNFENGF